MLSSNLIIFPTSRAIREYTINYVGTNDFIPKLITIGDFFDRIIYTPNKTLIAKDLKTIYLIEAIKNCNSAKLGIQNDFNSFLKQSEYIFRFFNELSSEFKTIDDLSNVDTYALYSDHLDTLKMIQRNYYNILNKHSYIDQSLLPTNYLININYIKQYNNIVIAHEGIFSSYEQQVIDEVSKYVTIDIQYKEIKNKIKYNIEVTSVSQRIVQVGFIKQKIYQMITFDKIKPEKIAVVLPDESFSEVLALFDDEKYFNFAMGNNINQSKIKITVQTINKLMNSKEPKDINKIELFNIDKDLYENYISNNWNQHISKDKFYFIFEKLILCEDDKNIIEKLHELTLSLAVLFYTNNLNIVLKDMFKIIENKINKIKLDDISGGKITVIGLLETRAIKYDGVIVCDFNDDKVPKRSIKDKFLSTKIKEFASLPTIYDREKLQKNYYKNLFEKAKKVEICYVENDTLTKSRFINELCKNTKKNQYHYDFSKILYNKNRISALTYDINKDIDLSKQEWSATSLKIFLQCKRRYYLRYILKIKEHNISVKPTSYEIGNIIHKILENLIIKKAISSVNVNNEISKYQTTNPYLTMELELWKYRLKQFIKLENIRKELQYKTICVEKPFKINYNGIVLKGIIDRIDISLDGKYDILDYKTSSNLKIDTNKTYEQATDFQLEFYLLSQTKKNIKNVAYYDLYNGKIKIEIMLVEKLELLNKILDNLKTTKVNFQLCEEKIQCLYCPYQIMCGRD
jgi:hypothetical protein